MLPMNAPAVVLAVLAWYALASLASFAAYAIDKRRASLRRPRTPEATLLLIDLLGGWPGGLLARHLLRHKTRKVSYRVRFWLVVVAHAAAWATLWRLAP